MLTSVIIPSYNEAEMLRMCLDSIHQFTPEPHEIIVVDNGSTDHTMDVCRQYRCKFIRFPANRGFPAACNAGLRLATGDLLLLLNNDVIVANNWLRNMHACLCHDESVGIVGPYTNYASGQQQMSEVPYVSLEQYMRLRPHMNASDPARYVQTERLVGFCMLFRRRLMQEIGLLDERFSPGHYEDDDYCHRARMAGYKLMIAGDTFVHHHGSLSFRKQRRAELKSLISRNLKLFIDKWGYDPRTLIRN